MTKILTHKLLKKHMLKVLNGKIMQRRDWQLASQIGHQTFDSLLKNLLQHKLVERVKHGVYKMTNEGKRFITDQKL